MTNDANPAGEAASARGPSSRDDFFVGYLKTPDGLARFHCWMVAAVLMTACVAAFLAATAQIDPGDGQWDTGSVREFAGFVVTKPYPMLRTRSADGGAVETLLLVEMGKFGGGQRAAAFDGKFVRVSGWLIERDGRRMLELEPGDALKPESPPADASEVRFPASEPLGEVMLRGEIVDSKCYLGAMKPGEGKTHKECATRCIAGGIPPMLVTYDSAGRRVYYLMTDEHGSALDNRILPFIADAIEVRGSAERRGDLLVLRVNPANIRRR